MMRTDTMLRARFADSDDSGSDSDSTSSVRSEAKKVQFSGFSAVSNQDKNQETNNDSVEKIEIKKKHRIQKKNGFTGLKINRGDMPDGSDLFRQVLKEIQTESDEECLTPRSDSSASKPLKSILKRKSDL